MDTDTFAVPPAPREELLGDKAGSTPAGWAGHTSQWGLQRQDPKPSLNSSELFAMAQYGTFTGVAIAAVGGGAILCGAGICANPTTQESGENAQLHH